MAHRGSQNIKRETIEAECVASADAISHIDNFAAILHLAWAIKGKEINEGIGWSLKKIERSWDKLIPEAKTLIKEKYKAIRLIFKNK